MIEKIHTTDHGAIHYWVSDKINSHDVSLILLPGLTADHRLFDKQVEYFEGRCNVLVWDAPGHDSSNTDAPAVVNDLIKRFILQV